METWFFFDEAPPAASRVAPHTSAHTKDAGSHAAGNHFSVHAADGSSELFPGGVCNLPHATLRYSGSHRRGAGDLLRLADGNMALYRCVPMAAFPCTAITDYTARARACLMLAAHDPCSPAQA